jgi:CheY-like chemotaxis protein
MTAPDTPAFLISDRARAVGLSRATLLPYERIGLLRGRRQAKDRETAMELGANAYRTTPFSNAELVATVSRLAEAPAGTDGV